MILCPISWAGRVWALPFLTVLASSERYHQERNKRHKTLADWARQMLCQVRRWLPDRVLVVVADSDYAVLDLLHRCQTLKCHRQAQAMGQAQAITMITRLRLDAALYEPAPERKAGQTGRPRKKGKRLPTLGRVLNESGTTWTALTVARWYSQAERQIEVASQTAV